MSETLESEIANLPNLDRAQLRAKWRSALKRPAPPHLRKELLVPLLAYKLQEQVYGGLSGSARRRLRELAAKYESSPKQPHSTTSDPFRAMSALP